MLNVRTGTAACVLLLTHKFQTSILQSSQCRTPAICRRTVAAIVVTNCVIVVVVVVVRERAELHFFSVVSHR